MDAVPNLQNQQLASGSGAILLGVASTPDLGVLLHPKRGDKTMGTINAILDNGGAVIAYFCESCTPEIQLEEGQEFASVEPYPDSICFRCGEAIPSLQD